MANTRGDNQAINFEEALKKETSSLERKVQLVLEELFIQIKKYPAELRLYYIEELTKVKNSLQKDTSVALSDLKLYLEQFNKESTAANKPDFSSKINIIIFLYQAKNIVEQAKLLAQSVKNEFQSLSSRQEINTSAKLSTLKATFQLDLDAATNQDLEKIIGQTKNALEKETADQLNKIKHIKESSLQKIITHQT